MFHIIVNPIAGKTKAIKALEVVKRLFDAIKEKYVVYKTERKGQIKEIVSDLTKKEEVHVEETVKEEVAFSQDPVNIVVIGGDGSLHEALNGINDFSNCKLGLIPAGTGNDFAVAAGIPEDVEKATKIILDGNVKDTDYIEIDNLRCMNIGGIGMDVDVLERYEKRKNRNKMTYLSCLFRSLAKFKGIPVTMEYDGKKEEHQAYIAAVCNGTQFGGGIKICSEANIEDKKLTVTVVETIKGFPFLKAIMDLLNGKILKNKHCSHFTCDSISIKSENDMSVQMDGEIYRNVKFNAKIMSGLKMYRV